MPSEMAYDADERAPRRTRPDGLGQREDRISKELARMDEALDTLAERIGPILGPERPSPALMGATSSEDAGSDLTRFLEHVADRQAALASRLGYLTDRIDL